MRRQEDKFASPQVKAAANRLASIIRISRLGRNMTQEAAAERAKMSTYTWMKIERGEVSVSTGAWLSALECLGLLDALTLSPNLPLPMATQPGTTRLRARSSASKTSAYDF